MILEILQRSPCSPPSSCRVLTAAETPDGFGSGPSLPSGSAELQNFISTVNDPSKSLLTQQLINEFIIHCPGQETDPPSVFSLDVLVQELEIVALVCYFYRPDWAGLGWAGLGWAGPSSRIPSHLLNYFL